MKVIYRKKKFPTWKMKINIKMSEFERTNNSFILNVYLAVVEFIKWKIMSE